MNSAVEKLYGGMKCGKKEGWIEFFYAKKKDTEKSRDAEKKKIRNGFVSGGYGRSRMELERLNDRSIVNWEMKEI